MPLLAHGSNCTVFHTIGLLSTNPLGASENDIAKYTCLSLKTIRIALTNLLSSDLVRQTQDGMFLPGKYIEFKKPQTLPAVERNILSVMNDDVLNEDTYENSFEKHPFIHEAQTRKILEPWIEGRNLDLLSAKVAPELAEQWENWMANADRKRWRNPAGYCFGKLNADPRTKPPYVKVTEQAVSRRPAIMGALANLSEE